MAWLNPLFLGQINVTNDASLLDTCALLEGARGINGHRGVKFNVS
jgi:hypothetical protein